MCISVDFVLQSFLCSTISLEALNSVFLAFPLTGILMVDMFKCVILTFFPLVAFYGLSPFSPTLQSLVIFFFYCKYLWFLLRSDTSIFFKIGLTCLILLN